MEFIEKLFSIKGKRQKQLISELGIEGELRKELVGPEYEDSMVVGIDNDQFLKLLQSRKPGKVLRTVVHRSDTHVAYDFYIDLGQEVKVKTMVAQEDYSQNRTLFNDLQEMGYRYNSIQPKIDSGQPSWGVYTVEEVKQNS